MSEIFDNRYEIIRRLGSGGMADVFLAHDTHLGRKVAIKILYKRYARDEEFVARFRQEAHSAAGLNHPHIVSIYDRGEADGSYYIAMEFLDGKSLKEVIADHGQLPSQQSIDVAYQILQALQFAHEHQVIHRDIKPHNIVINSRGQVKVTDFGIARAGSASRMTETGSILGTAQYLSPEQAKGVAVEQGSDLYSLGIVLYEMLTGQVPFEGENPVAIALKHLSDAPVPPQELVPSIPDNLNAVVMRALAKDPRDRYASAEDFMADLDRCRQSLPVVVPASVSEGQTSVIPLEATRAMRSGADATMVRPAAGKPPGGRRKYWYMLMVLAALAFAAVGVYFLAFAQEAASEVPNVVGLDLAQAEEALKLRGFKAEVEAEEFSDSVASGRIIRQNPGTGARLQKNGTVRLVISRGDNKVAVPADLAGQPASLVEQRLKEAGLTPDRQPDAYSSTIFAGNVISLDPPEGSEVAKGSTVKYVVSKGPEPPKEVTVTVPDVRGLTVDQASNKLNKVGLNLGDVSEQYSSSVAAGRVISQSPSSGSKSKEGMNVSVVVSKGPEPSPTVAKVTVPDVVDKSQASAVSQLSAAGLLTTVIEENTLDPTKVGKVISQTPEGGTSVDEGSSVTIYVGKSPI